MSAFRAADTFPFNQNWAYSIDKSLDYELSSNLTLQTLRSRSRQLVKDDHVVSGLQEAFITMILSYGPQIYVTSKNRLYKDRANDLLEGFLKSCDTSGSKSLNSCLEEVVGCAFADGDILAHLPLVSDDDSDISTRLELIEAHRIKNPMGEEYEKFIAGKIRNGVEYDEYDGSILGYWVVKADKVDRGATTSKEVFKFVPAHVEYNGIQRRVSFLFKALKATRPLGSRQYPMTTPLMLRMKMMDDFVEAVVIGARVAACFSAFVTVKNPIGARKTMTYDPTKGTQNTLNNTKVATLQPGMINYLQEGEEISFASPNKPSDNTDSMIKRQYKTYSMALRMPYIIAFLDTEEVSYSSWRGAVIEGLKNARRWHREFEAFISWIVTTVLVEAEGKGLLRPAPEDVRVRVRWPANGILDPEKEARANKIDLELGSTSLQNICDERGVDYQEILEERLQEELDKVDREAAILIKKKELEAKHGIVFDTTKVDPEKGGDSGSVSDDSDEESKKERRKNDGNW